jgi:hypothetical protein
MQGSFVLAALRARPPLHLILPGKPLGTYQVGRERLARLVYRDGFVAVDSIYHSTHYHRDDRCDDRPTSGVLLDALIVSIVAAVAALGSAAVAILSLRMVAGQTKSLSDQVQLQAKQTKSLSDQVQLQAEQTAELVKQTELEAEQYKIVAASTELQFNLNVMIRLQEILFAISDDKASRKAVWGDMPDGRREVVAGDALLDVVEMALKACERLPNFASNEEDWSSYTEYIMTSRPSIRTRVLDNPKWYPEITPYAKKAQEAQKARRIIFGHFRAPRPS